MLWRRLGQFFSLLLLVIGGLITLTYEWPPFGDEEFQIEALIGQRQFDFFVWEADAILTKAEASLANGHTYLNAEERKQTVLDTLELIREAQRLDFQINQIYVDPDIDDPDTVSAKLQIELAQKRAALLDMQPIAEAILQEQVAAVLIAEGFDFLGQAWPPVMVHMTPLPSLLIVSPRDRIERTHGFSLVHGLTTPAMEELETAVYENLDLSALVVPIGGMGTYPAMISESGDINWLAEVTAHEWSHHWMGFYPISINYMADPRVRIINETVASIIDREVAAMVVARYYPEFVIPPPPANASLPLEPDPNEPPPFDAQAELVKTRIQVDALLAQGKIDAAEAFMEERRIFFVENGYLIRKLNQAFFAFYGAYAAQPGAAGDDPIGPLVRDIRAHSASLRLFMERMAPIASFEDLEQAWRLVTNSQ